MESFMYNNSSNSSFEDEFKIKMRRFVADVRFVLLFVETFVITFGLLGNLIALIVINRKCLRNTSSSVFITALAIFDSWVLITHGLNLIKISGNGIAQCILYNVTDLVTFCASWFLVIITIERFIAVYSPLLAKRLSTVKAARYAVCIFVALSIIGFSIKLPIVYDLPGARATKRCRIYKKFSLLIRIHELALCYGIPGLFLLSNIFTVYSLCRRKQNFINNSPNVDNKSEMRVNDVNFNRKQRQLTIMLLTVILSFYIFTTPAMIFYIMEHRIISHRDEAKFKQKHIYSQMSVVLLQLNNATNFIFYCFAGQRFRRATLEAFYDYASKFRIFYHRQILGDKEYILLPVQTRRSTRYAETLLTRVPRSTQDTASDRGKNLIRKV